MIYDDYDLKIHFGDKQRGTSSLKTPVGMY